MACLTTEEIQNLIDLLEEIHDINLLSKRNTLLSGLPQWLVNKVMSSEDVQVHLTSIVNTLGCEAYFKTLDDLYPITIVVQNAQREAGKTALGKKLQEFLLYLSEHYEILPMRPLLFLPEACFAISSTNIANFYKDLEEFIQAVIVLPEELNHIWAAFSNQLLFVKCIDIGKRISDLGDTIAVFEPSLRLANTTLPIVIAHGLWLTKEVANFKRETQLLLTEVQHFCQAYGSALEQPAEKREDLQRQLAKLKQRCIPVLKEAGKLQDKLRSQIIHFPEQRDIS